jgi:hypothetical protein
MNSVIRFAILSILSVAALALNSTAVAACTDPNTCYGTDVLSATTTGYDNSGFGYQALYNNTTGFNNAANGSQALYSNTTGGTNTASGSHALYSSTTGGSNTASGAWALYRNTAGDSNTASGFDALFNNSTGYFNTASGAWAMFNNTTGHSNTASGTEALYYSTTGHYNTASGYRALVGNTTGDYNTASGYHALANNFTGNRNTAYGAFALLNATSNRNVALGESAGYNILTGANNIMIGAGQKGSADDSGVIRIGTSAYQTKAIIAGIRGVTTGSANAVPVLIDSKGQLGTISSSRRMKEDIQQMGSVSERLFALRPVTFRYKQPYEDGSKPVQFGLIAEEVAKAFPELAIYDEEGKPETVRYDLVATLLLNEFQKEHAMVRAQAERIAELEKQAKELAQLRRDFARMAATIERLDHASLIAATH